MNGLQGLQALLEEVELLLEVLSSRPLEALHIELTGELEHVLSVVMFMSSCVRAMAAAVLDRSERGERQLDVRETGDLGIEPIQEQP